MTKMPNFMKTKPHKEILLVDKPKGITSFDVIRRLRKKLNIKKMGHGGTLDPLASGLMIIGVGKGTKKLTQLIKLDKTYVAEVVLGESRETGDMEGEIIDARDLSRDDFKRIKKSIKQVLKEMKGEIALPVPKFSAIKRDGVALYKKARKGQDFDVPIKKMKVIKYKLQKIKYDSENKRVIATIKWDVGSGTYIRSLAVELGSRLDVPATLGNLRRTRIGKFKIRKAMFV
jgi:tRNA pseudouridine55 synthase